MSGALIGQPMARRNDNSGDGPDPRDFRMYQIEFKRQSSYKNTALGYDSRYLFNK